ncbi:MAG: FAD-binding oxidoreductase [Beijerinckiaceae bacterium]|nr:FAD-binding oxidoreductase [Beijerinckiaceae bacterium]
MADHTFTSWGGLSSRPSVVLRPTSNEEADVPPDRYLAVGNGRSYGDTALPANGTAIDTRQMTKVLSFDRLSGVLRAEPGILLAQILDLVMEHGWFLPVTPGTRFVTLGGALANDVHGKNHHCTGTFGRHVRSFELLRSNGVRLVCTPKNNPDYFAATIGGMGLTGLVTWVEISLMRAASPHVMQTSTRFSNLDEYFERHADADGNHEYGVAWLDSLASGSNLGRGILMLGDHAEARPAEMPANGSSMRKPRLSIPFTPPLSMISPLTLRAFNAAYYNAPRKSGLEHVDYRKYFYPLDGIDGWNRLYGPRGLRQFQCVVPADNARDAVAAMLRLSQRARHGSFLTVLKKFGTIPSPGILSFPRPGFTLTLDFPYRGEKTDRLLGELDAITLAAGGAVNPYKDARMSREVFEASFPDWRGMLPFMDPQAQSLFSKRIGLHERRAEYAAQAA